MALAAVSGGQRFESSYGNGTQGEPSGPAWDAPAPQTPISEHVMRMMAIGLGAGAAALFADIDPVWIGLGPVGYALAGPIGNWFLRVAGRWPRPEFSQDTTTTLRVEHIERDDAGRTFIGLYDLPEQITLEKLQHVANICLPRPVGEGKGFSKPALKKPGTFSQPDYDILREHWLATNHCFWRDEKSPTRGVELTERTYRLLKKSLLIVNNSYVNGQMAVLTTKTG